jgi:RHS repeat-associated protein
MTKHNRHYNYLFFKYNYYSFGSLMQGRSFTSTNRYRYGFNGKEMDTETETQDYGMRIYNPGLGRFLSVDPITRKYPFLTPYQFSSNRPIDGIDMDGLEYITVNVLIKDGKATFLNSIDHTATMTDAEVEEIHKMPAAEFYKEHSKSYGKEGQGILYNYFTSNEKGELSKVGDYMENKESLKTYGIYAGGGCMTKCGGNDDKNPFVKPSKDYDFTQTPLDEYDAIAQKHDVTQSKIPDFKGHWKDARTLESDATFVKETEEYLKRATQDGYVDKYTGRKPSEEAIKNAKQGLLYFNLVEVPQKEKLRRRELRKIKTPEQVDKFFDGKK